MRHTTFLASLATIALLVSSDVQQLRSQLRRVLPDERDIRVRSNLGMIILEGEVPPGVRRMEGPFGDHFGHYSEAAEFPVFRVKRVTRRRNPVYPATVVGKPRQEDFFIGDLLQDLLGVDVEVRAAGLDVEVGLLEAEAKRLTAPFAKRVVTGMPWVIAKWAMREVSPLLMVVIRTWGATAILGENVHFTWRTLADERYFLDTGGLDNIEIGR